MNISWVVAANYSLDPVVDLEKVKAVGPIWGSYRSWRSCGTDNVICHSSARAQELIKRDFHKRCNFYTYKPNYQILNRPSGVHLYEGATDFTVEVDDVDDVVAMHLASSVSDIVLLLGFELNETKLPADQFEQHKLLNRHGLIRSCIAQNLETQWVAVDHTKKNINERYSELANLTCDNMSNVLQSLV